MGLRERFTDDLKIAMKAGEAKRVSTVRLIIARMKEADIASRPRGVERVGDDELVAMLRGMVKQRRDSIALYRQGNREELAAGEEAEIAVIDTYLPAALDASGLDRAVDEAIAASGASGPKEIGKVMAALKAAHGAALDMGQANAVVKAKLSKSVLS